MVAPAVFALMTPGEQSFIPRPFGGGTAQMVLNTTSFASILGQLGTVAQARREQLSGISPLPIPLLDTGCALNATSERITTTGGNGVRGGDGVYRDCVAACAEPGIMFNSSYTFYNCLTLGAASWYHSNNSLTIDAAQLADAGADLGFASLNDFNATQIFGNALSCIKSSCQDYSLGSCDEAITTLDVSDAADKVLGMYVGLEGYCDGMTSVVNSDIAGPGVVVSYILQAALAMSVSLFINLFTNWSQPILSLLYTIQDRMTRRPDRTSIIATMADGTRPQRKTPWQRAGEHQKALSRSRPAAALTSALVEFQEVQGFFVLSIQLATLITYSSTDYAATLSSTYSFAEAVMNVEIVQMLSINGMLPVLFTQIGLMRLGVRWWYMTAIVLGVFTFAIALTQKCLMPDYDTLWAYFKTETPIDTCGGNPSPMTYCLDSLTGMNAALRRVNSGLMVACVAVPMLVLDQAYYSLNSKGRMDEALDEWEASNKNVLLLRKRVWPIFRVLMWFGLEFVLLVYVGLYLKSVVDVLQFVGTETSNWTFGQLIALMVWAPVIAKYVYFNMFGITEGVGRRLASRYKVVEVEEDDNDDNGDDDEKRRGERGDEKHGIEMKFPSSTSLSRKGTLPTMRFSRENTLVATPAPCTPRTPYADSPVPTPAYEKNFLEDYGPRKNNPFDYHGGGKI